ncbi:hypothetical protein QZM99_17805 [Burkholderia gladioli]|uniref:hypothetical protein n=1 Tax=Burkholderia gladioli TaxID=28095 RepID=UPI002652D942|nr:hypothetical protein [Burkholderia gladioli]MDN7919944.1 hypothetical protein [Burkholderia gladioli]
MSGVPIADAAQPGMSSASTLDAPGELTRASLCSSTALSTPSDYAAKSISGVR